MKHYAILSVVSLFFITSSLFPQSNPAVDTVSLSSKRLQIQMAHYMDITQLKSNPKDGRFATASADGSIKIWNSNGFLLKTICVGGANPVLTLAWSPDGTKLAAEAKFRLVVWNSKNSSIKTHEGVYRPLSLQWSPDGKQLISAGNESPDGSGMTQYLTVTIRNDDGSLIGKLQLTNICGNEKNFSLSPRGDVACIEMGAAAFIKDITGKIIKQFDEPLDNILWNKKGDRVLLHYQNQEAAICTSDFKVIATIKKAGQYYANQWSNEGKFIAIGHRIYDSQGALYSELKVANSVIRPYLQFSPDDAHVIVNEDLRTELFDLKGTLINASGGWGIHGNECLDFSHDSKKCYTAAGNVILVHDENLLRKKVVSPDQSNTTTIDPPLVKWDNNGTTLYSLSGDGYFLYTIDIGERFKYDSISTIRDPKAEKLFTGMPVYTAKRVLSDEYGRKYPNPAGKQKLVIESALSSSSIYLTDMKGAHKKYLFKETADFSIIDTFSWYKDKLYIQWRQNGGDQSTHTITLFNSKGNKLKELNAKEQGNTCFNVNMKNGYLATGSKYGNIKIWDAGMKLLRTVSSSAGVPGIVKWSNDGKYLAAGFDNGTISLWNDEGILVTTIKGHDDKIYDLDFNNTGEYLVSSSYDNTIRIWQVKSGNSIAYFISRMEYIVFTDDGYWDGSRNAGGLAAVIHGLDAYAVDQFAVKNNRPDLILKHLGKGAPALIDHLYNQYRKRLRKLEKLYGIKEADLSGELHMPTANIESEKKSGQTLKMKISLNDSKYDVRAYNIYVNDVPLYLGLGKTTAGKSIDISEEIELSPGENKIEVSCINVKGVESYRAITYATDTTEHEKGNLYYIGFGVSEYQNPEYNLGYAGQDAIDLGNAFKKMEGGEYHKVFAATYTDSQVTVENIIKARYLLAKATVNDTFVLFVAGHGVHDKDKDATYYYVTHNADMNNLKGTAADFSLIEELVSGIAPRKRLVLMDTCESGELDDSLLADAADAGSKGGRGVKARALKFVLKDAKEKISSKTTPLSNKRTYLLDRNRFIYQDLFRKTGAIVFSSCMGNEVSYEDEELENGFFTESILRALSGKANKDFDTMVSVDELREFVIKDVPEICGENEKLKKKESAWQHPTVDRDNLYQKFGFGVVP